MAGQTPGRTVGTARALRKTGDFGKSADGQAEGSKGNWRGIGDPADHGGLHRRHAKGDEHNGADGYGAATAGESLQERAETKCDQDSLHAKIGANRRKAQLGIVEGGEGEDEVPAANSFRMASV
jgi:hypothetical protein